MNIKALGIKLGYWLLKKCGGCISFEHDNIFQFKGQYFKLIGFTWNRDMQGEELQMSFRPPAYDLKEAGVYKASGILDVIQGLQKEMKEGKE